MVHDVNTGIAPHAPNPSLKTPKMNEHDDEQAQEIRMRVGSVMLWMGALTAVLMFIDRSGLNIVAMPAFWYRSDSLHLLICVGFFLGGLLLLRNQPQAADHQSDLLNKTTTRRRKFDSVRFYSRANCPLCDEAMDVLDEYDEFMPQIERVDIAKDQLLEEQHGQWIPVIEIDGRVRFRGRVDPVLLQRLISVRQREHDVPEQEESQ